MKEQKIDYTQMSWAMCKTCPLQKVVKREKITFDNRRCLDDNKRNCERIAKKLKINKNG